MSNPFYTASGAPVTGSSGSSAVMRSEYGAIEAAFDMIPPEILDGFVTEVSVETANGFSATVSDATSTPTITIKTTVTGLLKGDGTGVAAAVAGTDYAVATTGSSILKGDGSGGFSAAVSGTDYAPATTGSSILKGNGSGGFSAAVSATDYAPATSGSSILKGNGSGGFSSATAGTDFLAAGGYDFSGGAVTASGTAVSVTGIAADDLLIFLENVKVSSGSDLLQIAFSTDNGSNYSTAAQISDNTDISTDGSYAVYLVTGLRAGRVALFGSRVVAVSGATAPVGSSYPTNRGTLYYYPASQITAIQFSTGGGKSFSSGTFRIGKRF